MNNKDQIETKKNQLSLEFESIETIDELNKLISHYIGKSGTINVSIKEIGANKDLTKEQKKEKMSILNEIKNHIKELSANIKNKIVEKYEQEKLSAEGIDLSIPTRKQNRGSIHPINIVAEKILKILKNLGFTIVNGPEIEDDFHNFTALNTPILHPARQMQDTFYLENRFEPQRNILRTQTSSVQIRTMQSSTPPINCVSFGKVYRSDWDSTHTPMFHQIEGLYVSKNASMSDLKHCITFLLREFFDDLDLKFNFRPSYFPFTEPSLEVDIFYKNNWVEVLGCGMINENVLTNSGIDKKKYTGFAFGIGIERMAMIKYNLSDIRLFFESDLRFLKSDIFNISEYI